ncbi:MAG: 3-keto-5-aminohexanoate cleavage protein [Oscillospiraceae bacterium]|nr:3-keto-5-aminohexanoate cleavage protein [Oscillospiraceae bacterium]
MAEKRIITVALTGTFSPKKVNPAVPVTPEEIAEDAYKCWKAGAAIVHLHMRNANDEACSDINMFRESQRLIKERCDIIINMTTTGTKVANSSIEEKYFDERIAPVVELNPEMCSYDAACFNWMNDNPWAFQNPPAFLDKLSKACIDHNCKPEVEIFNPGMFGVVKWYTDRGLFPGNPHFQYVLGVQGGLPATPKGVFELESYRKEMFPGSTWSGFGTSKGNLPCIFTAIALGGGIRVGLEDTGFYSAGMPANNEMLVQRAARIIKEFGCEPATPDDARKMLGIEKK